MSSLLIVYIKNMSFYASKKYSANLVIFLPFAVFFFKKIIFCYGKKMGWTPNVLVKQVMNFKVQTFEITTATV